jgi:hypothetical protein
MTGCFLKLQQAMRVGEQHLAIVGQCETVRCPNSARDPAPD